MAIRKLLVPLVVGITGHRDILAEDREALKKQVEEILIGLRSMYPYTPLVVLSALAEGSDRLVAEVALDLGCDNNNDVRLIAVLPMPRALYVTEFRSPESIREFAALLDRAERCFELPLCEGNDEDSVRDQGKPRDRQYEELGKHIADHSNILIALWDGVPGFPVDPTIIKRGGTAHNVAIKLGHVVDVLRKNPLDPPEVGPVYHIVTPRRSNPSPEGKFTLSRLYPVEPRSVEDTKKKEMYHRIFQCIDDFNCDCREKLESGLAAEYKESKENLLPEAKLSEVRKSDRSPDAEQHHADLLTLRNAFGAADALAIHFQTKLLGATKQLYRRVGVVTLVFVVAHAIEAFLPALIWLGLLRQVRRRFYEIRSEQWEKRYQDYRILAEGLRVQFFWRLAGLKRSVADNYLRNQRSELEWIRSVLRWFGIPPDLYKSADSDLRLSGSIRQSGSLYSYWVEGQYAYFHNTAKRREEKHAECHRTSEIWLNGGVSLGYLWALVLLLAYLASCPLQYFFGDQQACSPWQLLMLWPHEHEKWFEWGLLKPLPALSACCFGVAALYHSYAEKWAFSQQAKRYEKMSLLFESATPEEIRENNAVQLIVELGKEALSENGDWLIINRERPLELPHTEGMTTVLKASHSEPWKSPDI